MTFKHLVQNEQRGKKLPGQEKDVFHADRIDSEVFTSICDKLHVMMINKTSKLLFLFAFKIHDG